MFYSSVPIGIASTCILHTQGQKVLSMELWLFYSLYLLHVCPGLVFPAKEGCVGIAMRIR